MLWSFKNLSFFKDMHFMFQKEFGDRLVSENNKKSFGPNLGNYPIPNKTKILFLD
jgi:16S rRNA A1518/A1519 N6-dimethyltransferase RsmA/KsgA/DIM1 with predicted DNA glycosylase/AP lyase activity